MAINLITGQPGHGKTALAIVQAKEFSDAGREVYCNGIKNLNYESLGWKHIDEPAKWEELPDGAVVVLDECYSTFPNRNPGSKVPPHVDAMARHRHRGFDFILIAQQSIQIDPFLRGLIEMHQHVRQTSVFKSKTRIKRWDQWQSNTKAISGDIKDWVRPKWVFDYYTSTTLNTTTRTVPMWMRYIAVALVFVVGMVWWLKYRVNENINASRSAATTAGALSAVGRRGESEKSEKWLGSEEDPMGKTPYSKDHLPRFATMPWTAKIFDQRAPTADPQLYCMSSDGGEDANGHYKRSSCTCQTEQNTAYDIGEGECRRIARQGPIYNPYKSQQQAVATVQQKQVEQAPAQPPTTLFLPKADNPAQSFPETPNFVPRGG